MRIPTQCLVVLVGPSGAGKSYWAASQFRPDQIIASDDLRALVGTAAHDQRAGTDAFAVLDLVLERRLRRKLLTVVDTLGLDDERRLAFLQLARNHKVACHAVLFDTQPDVCKTRNRARAVPVPAKVLAAQLAARDRVAASIDSEGFDAVHAPSSVEVADIVDAPAAAARQAADPATLRFGLHLSSFVAEGPLATNLRETVAIAEAVGFSSLWMMDHLIQIPQVGRPWEDLPESWTTLAWVAAHSETARIGSMVTDVTLRHPAHLAKVVASLDVLSGGRAICGIGLGWWEHEHKILGIPFPPVAQRYELLQDTLELLPVMWGPGSPAYAGRVMQVAEATCYPRPLQEHVPVLVGGSGEKRTLRIAARLGDACNLFGDPPAVARRVRVVRDHLASVGRDASSFQITHLSTAVVARTARELAVSLDRVRGSLGTPEAATSQFGAGTVADQIGRYRQLAEAGVQTAIVALPDVAGPGTLESFGEVIAAFGGGMAAW